MKKLRLISMLLAIVIVVITIASCGIFNSTGTGKTKSKADLTDISGIQQTINADNIYTAGEIPELIENIDLGNDILIEDVSAVYVSDEYYEELYYNSIDNYFVGYSSTELSELVGNEAWFLSYNSNSNAYQTQIIDRAATLSQYEASLIPVEKNNTVRNLLIGGGVILVCVTLSVVGSPAVACIALSAAKGAVAGSLIGSGVFAAASAVTYRVSEGTWDGASSEIIESASQGFAIGAIVGASVGAMSAQNCFVAGTPILTTAGVVPIEQIQPQDQVLCAYPEDPYNITTGIVKHTFSNEVNQTYVISFESFVLETTAEHPFYIEGKGFIEAKELNAGDLALSAKGNTLEIKDIQIVNHDTPVKTYNFEVSSAHTYFAGEESVLVHNSCLHTQKEWKKTRQNYWKEQGDYYKKNYSLFEDSSSLSQNYPVTEKNIKRMLDGKAPVGFDGKSVQLHHNKGISVDMFDFTEMTKTKHYQEFKSLHYWLFQK